MNKEEFEDVELVIMSKRELEDIKTTYEEIGKLQNRLERAYSFIKTNCILSDVWETNDYGINTPIGRIEYKALSKNKIEKLLNILKGSDKE